MNPIKTETRVLLVEDHDEYADQFQDWLGMTEEARFRVEVASRLRDALVRIPARPPDVIVTDLGLPDASGTEAVQMLMEGAPQTPLVVLTVSEDLDVCMDAIKAGAQDFIVKGRHAPEFYGRILLQAMERKDMEEKLHRQSEEIQAFTHALADPLKGSLILLNELTGDLRARYEQHTAAMDGIRNEPAVTIARMEDSLDQMEGIVDQLLLFRRYGGGPGRQERVAVLDIVRETHRIYTPRAEQMGITLRLEISTNRTELMGDEMQLRHLLMNLLEYTIQLDHNEKTEVSVRLFDDGPAEAYLVLAVQDDGPGIDREELNHILTPFYRPPSSNAGGETLGIGPAVAARIAHNHNAAIKVQNRRSGGSRFQVRFPADSVDTESGRLETNRMGGIPR